MGKTVPLSIPNGLYLHPVLTERAHHSVPMGGIPIQFPWGGGTPGYHLQLARWGTPCQLEGVPPISQTGVSPCQLDGILQFPSAGWGPPVGRMGYHPPPPKCEQTDTCENSTFPGTPYVGGNNYRKLETSPFHSSLPVDIGFNCPVKLNFSWTQFDSSETILWSMSKTGINWSGSRMSRSNRGLDSFLICHFTLTKELFSHVLKHFYFTWKKRTMWHHPFHVF